MGNLARNYHNCIYILTNPLYAGYVKIGYATDLVARLASLNTGMLRNFDMYAVYETPNKLADKQFHALIDDLAPIVRARVIAGQKIQDKEFFKLEPEQAYDLFHHIAIMTGTEHKLHRFDEPLENPLTSNESSKEESTEIQTTKSKTILNHTEKPLIIIVGNSEYPFVTWVNSLILHCEKIIEKIGFMNFKYRVLALNFTSKTSKRKTFAETEEEMRGFSFHKFSEGSLYMLTNYSADSIKRINKILSDEFSEINFEYKYEVEG